MDDLEFVQKCATGDKRSWDEFVDKYSRLIYNYIHSVLKAKGAAASQENTSDIFQNIFTSLVAGNFKKLKSYQGKNGCSLASWLRQVVVNATIDYIRRSRPLLSIDQEGDDGFSLKDVLADKTGPVTDALAREEKLEQLKECIKRLNASDKYFLELHINQGVALGELKEVLGLPRGAVDMRKSRIIDRLKECFSKKGFMLDF